MLSTATVPLKSQINPYLTVTQNQNGRVVVEIPVLFKMITPGLAKLLMPVTIYARRKHGVLTSFSDLLLVNA